MKKWSVVGIVSASKYLGTVEADTQEQAEELAAQLDQHINLCHQCDSECDDPQINELLVEVEGE